MRWLPAGCILLAFSAASTRAATPEFTAKLIDGAPFSLAQQRGSVVIVNFWATWCAPCRAEMPALDRYYREHRGEGLATIAIAMDAGASPRKLQGLTSAFAFEVARVDDVRIERAQLPNALPETRIYGRDGTLRFDSASTKGHPPLDEASLDRIVAPLLKEGAATR